MASHPKLQQGSAAFKLLTAGTPNGHKATILLEELKDAYPDFNYDFEGISFKDNEQKQEWFLQVNPNGRIPAAIQFNEGGAPHYLFESASITLWLAEHVDKDNKFSFADPIEQSEALSWVFFNHGGVGPMQGQANHFYRYAPEKIPYGINRYIAETKRLYSVLEDRLAGKRENPASADGKTSGGEREYIVGKGKGKYSFVDINIYPWVRMNAWAGVENFSTEFPLLSKWVDRIAARPAAQRGIDIPEKSQYNPNMSKEEQDKKAEEAKQWIHKK
ncbi:Glutathione S-transferase 2 [Naganishia albida]|nr:Glutathione S-transferase 2 [Naganishia albida]